MNSTLTILCSRCGKEQMPRPTCVRCEKKLPDIAIVVVERVVEKEVPVPYLAADQIPTLAEAEKALILAAVDREDGDRKKAASRLGIGKTTLYRKLRKMELEAVR